MSNRRVLATGGTSLPALSDNGTVVTSTEQIQGANNTLVTAPTYSFAGNSSTGIYNNSTQVRISSGGSISGIFSGTLFTTGVSGITFDAGTGDTFLARRGAANLRMGAADLNGTPVDQTLSVQNAITGSDLPGGHFTLDAPLGTGLGAASKISINRAIMKATGTTAQTSVRMLSLSASPRHFQTHRPPPRPSQRLRWDQTLAVAALAHSHWLRPTEPTSTLKHSHSTCRS
jgi:hypothetical protein